MFLWHGTYFDSKDNILKDKMLKCGNKVGETTKELNDLFEARIGFNPRKNCIYFSGDTESTNAFDYAFKIDTNNLNTDKLFVGDYYLLDEVFLSEDDTEITKLLQQYNDTLVKFEDYLKNTHNYLNRDIWELEFLYFDDVKVTINNLD